MQYEPLNELCVTMITYLLYLITWLLNYLLNHLLN